MNLTTDFVRDQTAESRICHARAAIIDRRSINGAERSDARGQEAAGMCESGSNLDIIACACASGKIHRAQTGQLQFRQLGFWRGERPAGSDRTVERIGIRTCSGGGSSCARNHDGHAGHDAAVAAEPRPDGGVRQPAGSPSEIHLETTTRPQAGDRTLGPG